MPRIAKPEGEALHYVLSMRVNYATLLLVHAALAPGQTVAEWLADLVAKEIEK